MADGLLLRPLPVRDPSRVVSIRARTPSGGFNNLSYPDFADLRDKSRSFQSMFAYDLVPAGIAKDPDAQPALQMGYLASGNFFSVLGITTALGRPFTPEEDRVEGRDAVLVLSHDLWKSEFGQDPAAVGRHVLVNGSDFVIVGVLPESFPGIDHAFRPAFYAPIAAAAKFSPSNQGLLTNRSRRDFFVKGRLAEGISVQAADAEIAALAKSLEESNPSTNRSIGAAVRTEMQFRDEVDPTESPLFKFLFTLAAIVLAIACANVANLMMNRARARSREIAVRLAIGSSRRRIVRQLLVESLMVAIAGGALGLVLTTYAVALFSTIQVPSDLPIQFTFKLDYRVLSFTAFVSILSAVLFGLIPALQSTKQDLVTALKSGESTGPLTRMFGRRALVAVQIAGSAVLVFAAAQVYGALKAELGEQGFRIDHRITMRFAPAEIGYNAAQTEQFYRTLLDRARSTPGVKSAALASHIPMTSGAGARPFIPEGYSFPRGQETVMTITNFVSEDYFETFGIPILAGRSFQATDRADSPPVAIVNEEFGRHYFKGDPVGKRLRLGRDGPWIEVAGVTATGKYFSVFEPPIEYIYLPVTQRPQQRMTLIAETSGAPAEMSAPLREMVRAIDPNMPVFAVRTMEDLFDQRSVKIAQMLSGMIGALGAMGLVLALVGLFGVVSYHVGRRTREIGIRMALGAAQSDVSAMVMRYAAVMVGTGILIGGIIIIAGHQIISGAWQLRGLLGPDGFNPVLLIAILVSISLTTMLAAAIPARKASRIDPQRALRQE